MKRRLTRMMVFVATALFVAVVLGQSDSVASAPCWKPPVDGVIADPFREPPCPWCAGNRGIEYETARSSVVRAVATGRVTFSGTVVGTLYVVTRLANGWRLTYGNIDTTQLEQGDIVIAGTVVGRTTDRFFFSVRDGNGYLDPAPFMGRVVGRQRLIPTDGTSPRTLATTRLRCEAGSASR